jgi:hypothetical protein
MSAGDSPMHEAISEDGSLHAIAALQDATIGIADEAVIVVDITDRSEAGVRYTIGFEGGEDWLLASQEESAVASEGITRTTGRELRFEPQRSGSLVTPDVRVEALNASGQTVQNVTVEGMRIEVASALAEGEDPAQAELSGRLGVVTPESQPASASPTAWVIVGASAVVLALIAAAVLRRRGLGPAPETPAYEAALAGPDRVEQDQLIERGAFERFYVVCSQIVRAYIEQRFGVRAPELTTEEFLAHAGNASELAAREQDVALLGRFLERADQVKFARAEAAADEARRALDELRAFVRATASRPGAEGES